MKLSKNMTEHEFMDAIDASFNFRTADGYADATRLACEISDNAVLMVGYELASGSSRASLKTNLSLLKLMEELRPTPVVLSALPVIEALLENRQVPPENIKNLLEECTRHGSAWNGLGILECADESLEDVFEQIRATWRETS